MTAPQIAAAGQAVPSRLVRARDVLAFEWTKLRSVRSSRWTLLIAAVVTVGVTAIVALSIASGPAPPPGGPANPLTSSFLGVGAVIRHTAGGIAAAVTVIYLLAALCLVLPSPWKLGLGRFTLPFAAYQLVTLHPQPGLLSPGLSVLVLIGWPAGVLLAAALVITHRDA
jgi:ABC-2 type transport system permease protein